MTRREKGLFIGCSLVAWSAAIVLAATALVASLAALKANAPASRPVAVTVIVQADGEWQSSGLYVQRGQRVLLAAAGAWRHDGYESRLYGPAGVGIHFDTAVLPEDKVGCLLARIGEGQPFAVGNSAVFEVDGEGELAFAMNDDRDTYGNNRGQVRVQLLVDK